ncbi:MAG TPA: DUF3313 family protein [Croceibacterium sp.]
MLRNVLAGLAALTIAVTPLAAQEGQPNWDGLVKVQAKKLDEVYLLPQADFREYTKVLLDPTEVAFRKNWQRDQNRERLDLADRVSDADARKILDDAQKGFQKYFTEAYTKDGYEIVTAPGPDVLRISTAIVNLDVTAPDTMSPNRGRTFSRDAGEATLVIEARDSLTGELLGRALDRRETSDMGPYVRNSVTNAAAFEQVFRRWAQTSAEGLAELKELSPVDPAALQAQR